MMKYNADELISLIGEEFSQIMDVPGEQCRIIEIVDALQLAYSMFALKSPSLLSFVNEMSVHGNLERVFKITRVTE